MLAAVTLNIYNNTIYHEAEDVAVSGCNSGGWLMQFCLSTTHMQNISPSHSRSAMLLSAPTKTSNAFTDPDSDLLATVVDER